MEKRKTPITGVLVTPAGNVYAHGELLQRYRDTDGRLWVWLSREKKKIHVHRLVAAAWVENPSGNPIVAFRDGDKRNCKSTNLEWVTAADIRDRNPRPQVIPTRDKNRIRVRLAGGERPTDIAREYGVSVSYISHIKEGRR